MSAFGEVLSFGIPSTRTKDILYLSYDFHFFQNNHTFTIRQDFGTVGKTLVMNTEPSTEEIDFWYKHGEKIRYLTKQTENILFGLKKQGWINSFEEEQKLKCYGAPDGFRLLFLCRVPYADQHTVKLRFQYALNRNFKKMKLEQRSRFANFVIDANMPKERIYTRVCTALANWKLGVTNETLFELFLKGLADDFPDRITHTFKTGKKDDADRGIDFIIRYLMRPEYQTKEVGFNLKSSTRHLEKHRERYPQVSTFVFMKENLQNEAALRRRFFKFLFAASREVVHY
jgi:hypothetical protein